MLALVTCMSTETLLAQRNLKEIPDPDPEVELRSFQLPEGFEINLFASEPAVVSPIHMNWDAEGRLWVACSPIYPHVKPGQKSDDRIVVLEDRDGDGRAEHHTVFTDELLIPTAVVPGDGGAYVANSTELLHLKDTDGDGRADTTRVMLSGFGTEDTHHIIHTFMHGPDGALYFNQSIYIHSHVETPWGVRRLGGGGTWRFRPESMELEVFVRGFVNPWGHQFDRWGQSFLTDGAYGEGINYAFPGAVYFTAPGAVRIVKGLNPGQPKECGLARVSGRHLPPDWDGTLVTNDFRANRVVRFKLSENGSAYSSAQQEDLVRSTHQAFRPIDVKQGPDGAIYIADWYNPIIQHGEVSFRDKRRDHTHGRIWRITHKDRPLVKPPKIVGASVDALLGMLTLPEDPTRLFARLELRSLGAKKVVPRLAKWIADLDREHADFEQRRVEGLWTYQALGVVEPVLLRKVLTSPDHHARAAAVRVLREWHPHVPRALAWLEERITDEHPQVRLEAVTTLRAVGTARAAELAMRALDRPVDRFLDFALWLTARELQQTWIAAFKNGTITFGGNAEHVAFALRATGNKDVVGAAMSMLGGETLAGEGRAAMLDFVGAEGNADQVGQALALTLAGSLDDAELTAKLIERLSNVVAPRALDLKGNDQLVSLLASPNASLRRAAARAAGIWKTPEAIAALVDTAQDETVDRQMRLAAIDTLGAIGNDAASEALTQLATDSDAMTRAAAIGSLSTINITESAEFAVAFLEEVTDAAPVAHVVESFLRLREGPKALAAALAGVTVPRGAARTAVQAAESTGLELDELIAEFRRAAGLGKNEALTPAEVARLVEEVSANGDAARGEVVYRRAELQCQTCHAIGGAGGLVGPDLISIGASAPVDYLVESLVDPNAKIKEGYHLVEVLTKEFEVLTGTLVRTSGDGVVLRPADGATVTIPRERIAEETIRNRSMMPSGLISELPRKDMVDLVRFLQSLGRETVAETERTARRWRVLRMDKPVSLEAVVSGDNLTWERVYSRASGTLPLRELPTASVQGEPPLHWLALEIEVTGAGKLALKITGARARAWLDGKPIRSPPEVQLGARRLLLAVEPTQGELHVTLEAATTAKARLVSGP